MYVYKQRKTSSKYYVKPIKQVIEFTYQGQLISYNNNGATKKHRKGPC